MNRPSDEDGLRRMLGGANDAEPTTAERKDMIEATRRAASPSDAVALERAARRKARRELEARLLALPSFFIHLRVGPGAATLCVRRADDSSRVYVGVALCSPLDQFDRPHGRLVSSRRRCRVESLAAERKAFAGLGFVFAGGADQPTDKEAFEAFEAWLQGTHHVWPLWIQRFVEDHQGGPIPVSPWESLMSRAR